MNRVYSLTDLGNGYFIPTMMDGKHFYHYEEAYYTLNLASERLKEIEEDEHFFEDEWHIVPMMPTNEEMELYKSGQKVAAIYSFRKRSGVGLKEAKDIFDSKI